MRRNGPYAPLSAHYSRDDAILALDAAENDIAELLFLRSLAYCAGDPRLDGYISDVALKAGVVLRRRKQERVIKAAETLAEVGVYVRESAGYRLRTWSKWNRTNTEIERKRETDRVRKGAPTPGDSDEPPDDSERTPEDFHAEDERNPEGTDAESLGVASRGRAPASNSTQRSTTQRNPPAVQDIGNATQPSATPPTDPSAIPNGEHPPATAGDDESADDAIAQARRRAGAKPDDGWTRETVLRICHGAAAKFETTPAEAYDRLTLLAGMPETHSPGRVLDDGAWAWAGTELLRMARDQLAREQSTAALEAQKAEHAATAATQAERRRRITKLAEADPDGWADAQAAATAELEAEGTAPLGPLVAARALDICERRVAS